MRQFERAKNILNSSNSDYPRLICVEEADQGPIRFGDDGCSSAVQDFLRVIKIDIIKSNYIRLLKSSRN